jgi:hypothetical protein
MGDLQLLSKARKTAFDMVLHCCWLDAEEFGDLDPGPTQAMNENHGDTLLS